MELLPSLLREAEAAFGVPREVALAQDLLPWEMDLIDRVCGTTRHHDVTIFVPRGGGVDEFALIHKPSDPPGVYWAPAGGVHEGESLAQAVVRETLEETGLIVVPERYVLRLDAEFRSGRRVRPWTSHVFVAEYVDGEPGPLDLREVESAAWVPAARFWADVAPLMKEAGWGRFSYRLSMARLVFESLGSPLAL